MADAIQAIDILNFALDAIQQRQQVIANNIANQNTPGFQASVVNFEDSLAHAISSGGDVSSQLVAEGLPSSADGNNVSLPAEMSLMSQTSLENQSVANALSAEFSLLQTAISG